MGDRRNAYRILIKRLQIFTEPVSKTVKRVTLFLIFFSALVTVNTDFDLFPWLSGN